MLRTSSILVIWMVDTITPKMFDGFPGSRQGLVTENPLQSRHVHPVKTRSNGRRYEMAMPVPLHAFDGGLRRR